MSNQVQGTRGWRGSKKLAGDGNEAIKSTVLRLLCIPESPGKQVWLPEEQKPLDPLAVSNHPGDSDTYRSSRTKGLRTGSNTKEETEN